MLYVDDTPFGPDYFDRCFTLFARDPVLGQCRDLCFTVRLTDTAFWVALCLYVKANGGSVFPLPVDTPIDAARRRAERSGSTHLIFGEEGEAALESMQVIGSNANNVESFEPSLIQMSSGTTGEPKCIARSWASIDMEVTSYVQHFAAGNQMAPIVACPVNHSYGLISGVLVALQRGLSPVIIRNLNPKYILRKLRGERSPLLYSSPTLLAAITLLAKEDEPLFAVMTSGTLMPNRWFDGIRAKVRHLHQQYGCSEAGCIALGEDITTPNQLGAPLPHLELIAGKSAAEPQEILVKLSGRAAIQTRDLGYLQNGTLHFVSRLDDMINVAGLNVYPSEVEQVVLEMPNVRDAVIFKRNHSFGNDQVCLQFVSDTTLPHHQVREWCSQRLSAHQVPMSIEQVATIPRMPNGKVSRKDIASAKSLEALSGATQRGVS